MPADIELRWSSQTADGKSIWHTVWLDAASFLGRSDAEIEEAVSAAKPGEWQSNDLATAAAIIRDRLPALEEAKREYEMRLIEERDRARADEAKRVAAEYAAELAEQQHRQSLTNARGGERRSRAEERALAAEAAERERRKQVEDRIVDRVVEKLR